MVCWVKTHSLKVPKHWFYQYISTAPTNMPLMHWINTLKCIKHIKTSLTNILRKVHMRLWAVVGPHTAPSPVHCGNKGCLHHSHLHIPWALDETKPRESPSSATRAQGRVKHHHFPLSASFFLWPLLPASSTQVWGPNRGTWRFHRLLAVCSSRQLPSALCSSFIQWPRRKKYL